MTDKTIRQIAERRGPFAVVYMDASHDSEDATQQWEQRRQSISTRLRAAGADADMIALFDQAMAEGPPARGRCGRVLIIDGSAVHLDEYLPEPPAQEVVRVSPLPYLVPLLRDHVELVPPGEHDAAVREVVAAAARHDIERVRDTVTAEIARAEGFAVSGLVATAEALRMARVDRLLIDPDRLGDRTVLVGADRAQVSVALDAPAGWTGSTAPRQTCRADEALPVAAILTGAEVIVSGGVPSEDGVAALVRHR